MRSRMLLAWWQVVLALPFQPSFMEEVRVLHQFPTTLDWTVAMPTLFREVATALLAVLRLFHTCQMPPVVGLPLPLRRHLLATLLQALVFACLGRLLLQDLRQVDFIRVLERPLHRLLP